MLCPCIPHINSKTVHFVEAILLCLLIKTPQLLSLTQHRLIVMQYVAFTCVLDVSTCTWVIFRHANTKNIQRKYNKNLSAPWPRSDKLVLFHQVYTFLFNLTVKKLQNVLCLSYVFRRKVSEILIVLYVSNPAEAVGFLRRKNPQHAFLRRG